jgi:hypothetical protein
MAGIKPRKLAVVNLPGRRVQIFEAPGKPGNKEGVSGLADFQTHNTKIISIPYILWYKNR